MTFNQLVEIQDCRSKLFNDFLKQKDSLSYNNEKFMSASINIGYNCIEEFYNDHKETRPTGAEYIEGIKTLEQQYKEKRILHTIRAEYLDTFTWAYKKYRVLEGIKLTDFTKKYNNQTEQEDDSMVDPNALKNAVKDLSLDKTIEMNRIHKKLLEEDEFFRNLTINNDGPDF